MPAGGTAMGFVYFAAAKYAGYTAYCRWAIQPQLQPESADKEKSLPAIPSAWKAGAVRTLLGLGVGAIVGFGFWAIPAFNQPGDNLSQMLFFAFLIPVRIVEWSLLLRWVYKGFPLTHQQHTVLIAVGIVASFLLDGLGILCAFVLPGGMWVC
jgi:hypothetical protein